MDISIFGLGYVGVVSAACLANGGHSVIGVDTQVAKVEMIRAGTPTVIEERIPELIRQNLAEGRLSTTADPAAAVEKTSLSLVCVGTPSQSNGNINTGAVERVCRQIGNALARKTGFHVVAIRSTILPGTMEKVVIPALESESGKTAGRDFGVVHNPEFMREGSAVHDFYHPPKTVIGEMDTRSGDVAAAIYKNLDAPLIRTKIAVAEMIKYADNAWHALKVVFGNEIGTVCKSLGIDSHEVMDIFLRDKKLNISPYYLKPGFAFGGSCLPKDLRALTYLGKSRDLELPVLNAVLPSNQAHLENSLRLIMETGQRDIGFLGFSFKAGTDDLRESPALELIERLLGKGCRIKIYDKNVNLSALIGANRDFIFNKIPHIAELMVNDLDEVMAHARVIVIGNNSPDFEHILTGLGPDQQVIDLVRAIKGETSHAAYKGICW